MSGNRGLVRNSMTSWRIFKGAKDIITVDSTTSTVDVAEIIRTTIASEL